MNLSEGLVVGVVVSATVKHIEFFCFVFVLLLLLKIETRDYFGLWKMVTQTSVLHFGGRVIFRLFHKVKD